MLKLETKKRPIVSIINSCLLFPVVTKKRCRNTNLFLLIISVSAIPDLPHTYLFGCPGLGRLCLLPTLFVHHGFPSLLLRSRGKDGLGFALGAPFLG